MGWHMNSKLFTDDSASRRKIISFAYLAQASRNENDLLAGITSIFKPIAKQFAGEIFDPESFCTVVEELYGLRIHPWAALDLVKRLVSNGVIIENKVIDGVCQYIYADIAEDYSSITEKDIKYVVDNFINFSTPKLQQYDIEISNEELSNSFLNHLVDLNFITTALRPDEYIKNGDTSPTLNTLSLDVNKTEWRKDVREASRINSLCAGFILDVFHKDKDLYDLVLKIVSGALIAEVVLNFQEPALDADLQKVNIILDTPFLMALLNLTCEKENAFALELCSQIKDRGAQLAVFEHSIDELVDNLKAVINRFENNTAFGATGRRLRDRSFNIYLRQILKDQDAALKNHNIRILKNINSDTSKKIFSDELENLLCNTYGYYNNKLAQERDALSIALIMRYRNGVRTNLKEYYNCPYIFLTENSFIPDKSMDFMKRRDLLSEKHVPPAVSGRYLAGLLWVLFGGKGKDLSRQLLLANCAAALEPKSDVVAKMHHFLSSLDGNQVDLFDSLMGEDRAGQYLMQYSLADASLLTKDNAVLILQEVQSSLTEKIEIQADLRIKEIEEKAKHDISLTSLQYEEEIKARNLENDALKQRLLDSEAEKIAASLQLSSLNSEVEKINSSIKDRDINENNNFIEKIEKGMLRAYKIQKRFKLYVEALILSLSILLSVFSSSYVDNEVLKWVSILGLPLISMLGFEFLQNNFLRPIFEWRRDIYFNNYIDTKELAIDKSAYAIDWHNLKLVKIPSTNILSPSRN